MSILQQKIMRQAKNIKKIWPIHRKKEFQKKLLKDTKIIDLLEKAFKSDILNMFKELMETMFKELKEP